MTHIDSDGTVVVSDVERLQMADQRIKDLEATLLRVAEVVAAQTFDVKALGKSRREILVAQVRMMLETVEGDVRGIRRVMAQFGSRVPSPVLVIRDRFKEDLL